MILPEYLKKIRDAAEEEYLDRHDAWFITSDDHCNASESFREGWGAGYQCGLEDNDGWKESLRNMTLKEDIENLNRSIEAKDYCIQFAQEEIEKLKKESTEAGVSYGFEYKAKNDAIKRAEQAEYKFLLAMDTLKSLTTCSTQHSRDCRCWPGIVDRGIALIQNIEQANNQGGEGYVD